MTIEVAQEESVVQLAVDLRMADTEVNVRFMSEDIAFVTVRYFHNGMFCSTHYECKSAEASAAIAVASSWCGEGNHELAEKAMPNKALPLSARWIP